MKRIPENGLGGAWWYEGVPFSPIIRDDLRIGSAFYTFEGEKLTGGRVNIGNIVALTKATSSFDEMRFPKYFIKYLTEEDIEAFGWERWEQECTEHIDAYTLVMDRNSYMLTVSEEYVKVIVKGSSKELNITLFRGKIRNMQQFLDVMKMCQIRQY